MKPVPLPQEPFPDELVRPVNHPHELTPKLFFIFFLVIILASSASALVAFYVARQTGGAASTINPSADVQPVIEENRKTYTNTVHGFSFLYPEHIPGTDLNTVGPLQPYEQENGGGVGVGKLSFFVEKKGNTSAQQWYDTEGTASGYIVTPLLSASVNTLPAYQFSTHSDKGSMNYSLLEKNSDLYIIYKHINPTLDNEILSTFTFIEGEQIPESGE